MQDWLAQFIVSWHQNTGKLPEGSAAAHTDIDAALAAAPPAVAALVPALHALLRSEPFSPERGVAAADGTRSLLLLWASLAPQDLLLCIYPMLVAVENVEHVEAARCPLALATLQVCACPASCAGPSDPLSPFFGFPGFPGSNRYVSMFTVPGSIRNTPDMARCGLIRTQTSRERGGGSGSELDPNTAC